MLFAILLSRQNHDFKTRQIGASLNGADLSVGNDETSLKICLKESSVSVNYKP